MLKSLPQLRELSKGLKSAYHGSDTHRRVREFDGWPDRASADDNGVTGYNHAETVKEYYDLCGEFMVFGWGESLHFAPLSPRESLEDSKIRHQRLIIDKLELSEGMTVIDIGCGIGGPMRRVAMESGVRVVGLNNNEIQLDKAKSLNAEAGLDHLIDYLACSFMNMGTVEDGTFDRAYAIESTCHAPDKTAAFREMRHVHKVLAPAQSGDFECSSIAGDDTRSGFEDIESKHYRHHDCGTRHENIDHSIASIGQRLHSGMRGLCPDCGEIRRHPIRGMPPSICKSILSYRDPRR